jgi:hypothetical protein
MRDLIAAQEKTPERQPLISQYKGQGLLYAFVYRLAQRRVLSELRSRSRASVSISDDSAIAAASTDTEGLGDVKAALAEVIGSLSVRERIVLRMTCNGCSNSEIARRISSPGNPPIHDGRISHMRNGIVKKFRESLGILAESLPNASTLISDLLDGPAESAEVTT